MSRAYDMQVTIRDYVPNRKKQIIQACMDEWNFSNDSFFETPEEYCETKNELIGSEEGTLCGGESEEEFTDSLTEAIWRANKGYCFVVVVATYLEDLPYTVHTRDEDDYACWANRSNNPS